MPSATRNVSAQLLEELRPPALAQQSLSVSVMVVYRVN